MVVPFEVDVAACTSHRSSLCFSMQCCNERLLKIPDSYLEFTRV